MQISNMGILLHIHLYSLLLCENLSQNVTCYCFCQPISFWCIWNSDRSRKGFYHTVLLVLHAKSTFSSFSKLPSILHIIPNNIAGSLLPIASYHYGCEALPNMSFSCPVSVSLRSFPFGFLKKKRYQKLSVFFFITSLYTWKILTGFLTNPYLNIFTAAAPEDLDWLWWPWLPSADFHQKHAGSPHPLPGSHSAPQSLCQ